MSQIDFRRKRARLKAGDILTIPREIGGYYFVIYIVSNRFGDAFGLFNGHDELSQLSPDWNPTAIKFPIYSGKELVANGRWQCVGKREDLLALFPESPPIYHRKADNASNDLICLYGSAETASGALSDLTEFEADQIGLNKVGFRQLMMEEEFEKHLRSVMG